MNGHDEFEHSYEEEIEALEDLAADNVYTKNASGEISPSPPGAPLKQEIAPELEKIAEKLWDLLDDIDTASDMFKPKDLIGYQAFYRYVMKKAEKRHELLFSDGYELFYRNED